MKKLKGTHGGKRANSGARKGAIYKPTLEKAAARELVRAQITAAHAPMVRVQIAHAMGIGHVYTRDKFGKFTRIEDIAEIDRLLAEGTEREHYWIFAKDPSPQSFTDLMNRSIDKPKEQDQTIDAHVEMKISWQ